MQHRRIVPESTYPRELTQSLDKVIFLSGNSLQAVSYVIYPSLFYTQSLFSVNHCICYVLCKIDNLLFYMQMISTEEVFFFFILRLYKIIMSYSLAFHTHFITHILQTLVPLVFYHMQLPVISLKTLSEIN